jgi:hypothetical protein
LCSEFSLAGRLICMTRHEVCRIRELNLTNLSDLVTEICEEAEIFLHRPRLGWRAWPCVRGLCIRDLRDVLKAENRNWVNWGLGLRQKGILPKPGRKHEPVSTSLA